MDICSKFLSYEKLEGAYLLHTDNADIKLYFMTDNIIRIRASFTKKFPEESYVLLTTAWTDRLDPIFEAERKRIAPVEPVLTENSEKLCFETAKLKLVIGKEPISIMLYDKEENILFSTEKLFPFTLDSNRRITSYFRMKEDDCFYGFGEKAGELNKNKKFLRERATDAMGYDAEKMDTLYKHIPFFIKLDRDSKRAIGMFYHNFYESVFNMGCEKSNYLPRYSYWQADGGDIDLFLLAGGTIPTIIEQYTMLTGRPVLLPKRALGYQGSSMFYPELEKDSDDAVLDFIDTVHNEGFPIDGFHLSSGYTSYKNKRCVFTWNKERFKNPSAYFAAMNEKGAQNVPNIKPGILLMHPYFDEFQKGDVFVKDSKEPNKNAVGMWWGGEGVFWDFTSAKARELWKKYVTETLIDVGTDSIWNDNCEYDSLMDKDAKVDFDGKGGTIGELKPVMSTLMCKLSNDAVIEHNKDARPYSVCRSGSSGIQHYAQTWCGDNYTSWETLRYNIPMITGMGLSGQPNEGADIGGFAGPAPEEELFLRWVQQGIFQARFSIHSASNDNTVTEPWMFRDITPLVREAILLRYRFMPYLYSLEYESSQTGAPIMRALVYEFQNDPAVYDESFDYMFGRDILLANVLEKGAKTRKIYLPKGSSWYDLNDKFRRYEGGQTIEIPVTLESIPMFLRESAIIPMAENRIFSMEKDKVTDLLLTVIPGEERSFCLYDDDGRTNNYKNGQFLKTDIHMSGNSIVKLNVKRSGSYKDTVRNIKVDMVKKERSPFWVSLSGKRMRHFLNRRLFEQATEGWYYSQSKRSVEIKYPNPSDDYELQVSFEDFDLIGM